MSIKKTVYGTIKKLAAFKASINKNIRSRVFIYHNVGETQVESFQNQISTIKAQFDEIVNASEFAELIKTNHHRSKRYACITFDDGFDDVFQNAKPILDDLGVTATIFLNQTLFDLTNSRPEALEAFINEKFPRLSKSHKNLKGLSKEQLKQLISEGYEIGGHTYSHVSVPKLEVNQFEQEITKQRQFLLDNFNCSIKSFAYPYGRKKDVPNWGASSLRNSGYNSGFSGISQDLNRLHSINPFEIPRTSVSLELTDREFQYLIKGSSDVLDKLTGQY